MEQLEKLLAAERARLHEPARPAPYVKVAKPASLSTQNDGTSCGTFCYAYVFFQFVGNHLALRLAMLDACVTGSARRGVIPA